ncbi:hypothetical protein PR202_ga02360 [Eleusine coracana subsp. coracana]|uniref:J domain-containing protein n=1 Tax=Eleusine coracana subsp. coracana TaxID=191504 RepID=A0AAV5BLF8_ELECO|nr:hypothetical protein PR202_ga02360 [Eleusine coracana subsp. coracana]
MWHPDKHKGDNDVTAKFQEINEAYRYLSTLHYLDSLAPFPLVTSFCSEDSPFDNSIFSCIQEYLTRFKGMILTCNGLGMDHPSKWYLTIQLNSGLCFQHIVRPHLPHAGCRNSYYISFVISRVQHLRELDPH